MTDATPGPDPTLADEIEAILDEHATRFVGTATPFIMDSIRASILARFGGTVCVDRETAKQLITVAFEAHTGSDAENIHAVYHAERLLIALERTALAQTETEAAAKEERGGPG